MATEKQIAANRANAQKSTGPTTAAGKAASSMNAVTSGVYAESEIIKSENPDTLNEIADQFYNDFDPANAMEAALLDNVIRDTWLLIRFARIDAEILDYKVQEALFKRTDNQAGRAFLESSAEQIRLQRRIDQTRRSQIQSFKEFERLQAERRAQTQPEPAEPLDVTADSSASSSQIGFVSSTPPEVPEKAPETEPVPVSPAAKTVLHTVPQPRPIGFISGLTKQQPASGHHVPQPDTALPLSPRFSRS